MKLDKHSEEDLKYCRPGVGVLFMNVGKEDIRAVEFYPSINGTLRTTPALSSEELHKWIEDHYQVSLDKEEVSE